MKKKTLQELLDKFEFNPDDKFDHDNEYVKPIIKSPLNSERVIDLHGCSSHEMIDEVADFLNQAKNDALIWVRIITGKGSGVLAQALIDYLNDYPKLIKRYKNPKNKHGGKGAFDVWLKY